jgi:hypothetical protein
MPDCAFVDKAKKPTDKTLAAALDGVAGAWDEFLTYLRENHGPLAEEWKFMKSGWVLLTKRKTRTVCYLFPAEGFFTVAFVLGEKAVEAARQSKLPKKILTAMEEAKPYAEGRGFYVECRKVSDLKHLLTLTAIKMES